MLPGGNMPVSGILPNGYMMDFQAVAGRGLLFTAETQRSQSIKTKESELHRRPDQR